MSLAIEKQKRHLEDIEKRLNYCYQFLALCEQHNIYNQENSITLFTGKDLDLIIPFFYDFGGNNLSISEMSHFGRKETGEFQFGYSHSKMKSDLFGEGMTYLYYPEYKLHCSDVQTLAKELLESSQKQNKIPCIVVTQSLDLIYSFANLENNETVKVVNVKVLENKVLNFSIFNSELINNAKLKNIDIRL